MVRRAEEMVSESLVPCVVAFHCLLADGYVQCYQVM